MKNKLNISNNSYAEYKLNRKNIDIELLINPIILDEIINIAIIIPHRKRITHLQKLITHFNNLEKNNKHNYDLYVIDQNNMDRFNRGILLNIGFYIASKNYNYDRYVFHDVDSYPKQELFNLYFASLDKNIHYASPYLGYKYNNHTFFGGVIGIKSNDFIKINGFPNTFFGWGGEDDSFYNRVVKNNIIFFRPNSGSYILEEHAPPTDIEYNNNKKINILNDLKNWNREGYTQIESYFINYKYFTLDDFINSYEINVSNLRNNAELLFTFTKNKNKINIYKTDYLAIHYKNNSVILPKDYVQNKINEKIQKFNGNKYFQHKDKPIYISCIEPLIYWNEIKEKIIDTFTTPKNYNLNIKMDNRILKIKEILDNEFKLHTSLDVKDLEDTLKFIYDTYNEIIYIRIRNNRIECSYHIYSYYNNIDWYKNLKYKSKSIDENIVEILEDTHKNYFTVKNPHFEPINNCLINLEAYNYFEGNPTSYVKNFIEMIKYTINKFKIIPDCDLLLNRKDFSYLRKDNKYAYTNILNKQIPEPLNKYWIIGGQSKKKINLDIPIPTSDEWDNLKDKIKFDVPWENKKNIAIFRGSSTGCGTNSINNKRIKLVELSSKSKLLDVGLTAITIRPKVYNSNIEIINKQKYLHSIKPFMNKYEQSKYKYIFNIEGNAQAYRYPTEFKKKSVILNIKSEFYMWFEPLLRNNRHYIEIDENFNNLFIKLNYLITNDDKANKIARNGYRFYKKYINKRIIATYWLLFMYNINMLSSNIN